MRAGSLCWGALLLLMLLLPTALTCNIVASSDTTSCTSRPSAFGYKVLERARNRIELDGAGISGSVGGTGPAMVPDPGGVGGVSLSGHGLVTFCSTCMGTCAAPQQGALCPGDSVSSFRIPLAGSTATVCVGFGATLPFADNATSASLVTLTGSALSVTIGGGPWIQYTAGAVATAAAGKQLVALLLSDARVGSGVFFSSCGPLIVKQNGNFTNLRSSSSGRGLLVSFCDDKTGLWCLSAKVLADCSKKTHITCPQVCVKKPTGFPDVCGPAPVAIKCQVLTTGLMADGVCVAQADCTGSDVAWVPGTSGCEALANTRCCVRGADAMPPTRSAATATTGTATAESAASTAIGTAGELLASSLIIRVAPNDATTAAVTESGDSAATATLIGSIVGGALAGVLVLVAGAIGLAWHRQQRHGSENKPPVGQVSPLATLPPPQPVDIDNEPSARYVQRAHDLMSTSARTHVQYDALTAVESGRVGGDEMRSARADDSLRVESLQQRHSTTQAPRSPTTSHYDDIDGKPKAQW